MIYLSVCCVPDRISNQINFNKFLHALKNQKINIPYKIVLNIPYKFINYGNYEIPNWLNEIESNNIIILRDEIDYGPISNIIYPLKKLNTNNNDILIICDDDLVYHEDMISYHILKLNSYSDNHAICFRGNDIIELRTWQNEQNQTIGKLFTSCVLFPTRHDIYLKFPDHWHSVSYWIKNLNLDYLLDKEFLNMTWNNDLLMGYYGWDTNMFYLCANYYKEIDYRPVNHEGRGSYAFPVKEILPNINESGCYLFRIKDNSDIWDNTKFTNVMKKNKLITLNNSLNNISDNIKYV